MSAPKPVVDYYQLLEIDRTADHAAIDHAVRQQRRRWVSRQNAASLDRQREAEDRLAAIADAENHLLNEANRRTYDDSLMAILTAPAPAPAGPSVVQPAAGGRPAAPSSPPERRIDWQARAKDELKQGDLRAAKYSAAEATEKNPHDHEAWVTRSRVSMASRRLDDAIFELTEAIRFHPSAEYYAQLGNANQTAGYYPDAVTAFRKAGELDPAEPGYDLSAAQVWLNQHRVDLAIPILESLHNAFPERQDINQSLAYSLGETARSYLTLLSNGAQIFTSENQIAQSRMTINRALSLGFDDDDLRIRLGQQLLDADAAAKSAWTFPPKANGGTPWGRWIGWILLTWIAFALPQNLIQRPAAIGVLLGLAAVAAVIWIFFKVYRKPAWQRNAKRNKQYVQQWGI